MANGIWLYYTKKGNLAKIQHGQVIRQGGAFKLIFAFEDESIIMNKSLMVSFKKPGGEVTPFYSVAQKITEDNIKSYRIKFNKIKATEMTYGLQDGVEYCALEFEAPSVGITDKYGVLTVITKISSTQDEDDVVYFQGSVQLYIEPTFGKQPESSNISHSQYEALLKHIDEVISSKLTRIGGVGENITLKGETLVNGENDYLKINEPIEEDNPTSKKYVDTKTNSLDSKVSKTITYEKQQLDVERQNQARENINAEEVGVAKNLLDNHNNDENAHKDIRNMIPDVSEFITKTVNDLENYYLKSDTYSKEEINQRISEIPKFNIKVVNELPIANISSATLYLLKSGDEDSNLYTEYIYANGEWEELGSQDVDLTDYVKKEYLPIVYDKLTNREFNFIQIDTLGGAVFYDVSDLIYTNFGNDRYYLPTQGAVKDYVDGLFEGFGGVPILNGTEENPVLLYTLTPGEYILKGGSYAKFTDEQDAGLIKVNTLYEDNYIVILNKTLKKDNESPITTYYNALRIMGTFLISDQYFSFGQACEYIHEINPKRYADRTFYRLVPNIIAGEGINVINENGNITISLQQSLPTIVDLEE